ncbi:MAG: hypothetical protein RR609_07095 [Aurantimicrobium sp.]
MALPIAFIGGVITSVLGLFKGKAEDTAKAREQQVGVNLEEIKGAPPSILRLWRSFLGWIVALCFAWEVMGRCIFFPIIFPEWNASLPPSQLKEISALLFALLGLGG